VELVIANLMQNVEHAKSIVACVIETFEDDGSCRCGDALADALITRPEIVPAETRRRLDAITRRYWGDAP
jgi:5'-methylthioadenosine phosphorylase